MSRPSPLKSGSKSRLVSTCRSGREGKLGKNRLIREGGGVEDALLQGQDRGKGVEVERLGEDEGYKLRRMQP